MKTLKTGLKRFFETIREKIYFILNKNPRKSAIVMFCILFLGTIGSIIKVIYVYNKEPDRQTQKIYNIPKSYNSGIGNDILDLIELNKIKKEVENMDSTNLDSAKLIEINDKLDKMIKK
jgi:hypothetical protein